MAVKISPSNMELIFFNDSYAEYECNLCGFRTKYNKHPLNKGIKLKCFNCEEPRQEADNEIIYYQN